MIRYYKKGSLGRMVEVPVSDPNIDEVRMEKRDYNGLILEITKAERVAERTKDEAKKKVDEALEQANRAVDEYQKKSDEKAERERRLAEEKISVLKGKLEAEENLNRNMVRIMKERANQARGMVPKKDHDGYVVLESRQWAERYTEDVWDTEEHRQKYDDSKNRRFANRKGYLRIERREADVWKSAVQTPYNATIPIEQIRNRIEDELGPVLTDIGVDGRLNPEDNGIYDNFEAGEVGYARNIMYRWKYRANYRTGFWELEICTTESLRVPEHRRPPQHHIKSHGKRSKKAIDSETMHADDTSLDHTWYPDISDLYDI